MVTKKNINKIIKDFISELRHHIKIKNIYLFGSYVTGNYNKYSDIDLAIISKDFSGFKFDDRKMINPVILKTNINIEPHPFTLEEVKDRTPFISDIIKNGIKVY